GDVSIGCCLLILGFRRRLLNAEFFIVDYHDFAFIRLDKILMELPPERSRGPGAFLAASRSLKQTSQHDRRGAHT
ncbi:hypothetical protein, partial [Weissella cibaria]|uniref:hypothetical protein n=1 Tax=Weissella cibaria TaxID=137591 RepID=UPI00215AD482